jgi:hypothetical protein
MAAVFPHQTRFLTATFALVLHTNSWENCRRFGKISGKSMGNLSTRVSEEYLAGFRQVWEVPFQKCVRVTDGNALLMGIE